jgi:hypothetical protein
VTRKCPFCDNRGIVIDSRETAITVRRTRECIKCKARWPTWETTISPETVLAVMRKSMRQITRASQLGERAIADLKKPNSGRCPNPPVRNAGGRATDPLSDSRKAGQAKRRDANEAVSAHARPSDAK